MPKQMDEQTEEWKDGRKDIMMDAYTTVFYRTFLATAGSPTNNKITAQTQNLYLRLDSISKIKYQNSLLKINTSVVRRHKPKPRANSK